MKDEHMISIAMDLSQVPDGAVTAERHGMGKGEKCFSAEHLTSRTDGKGRIEIFRVMPGIEVSFHEYLAESMVFHHKASDHVLEITHCRAGRIGWEMGNGEAVYLGPGDICINSMKSCADSRMRMPLGYFEGASVALDLNELGRQIPDLLKDTAFDAGILYERYCMPGIPVGVPSGAEAQRIFEPLYEKDGPTRNSYYKLKAIELIMYLEELDPQKSDTLTGYVSQQTETVREIRDLLVSDLSRRFTIEELSRKYLMNTSTLKSVFKAVYGMPVASYVKEYRMKEARRLLVQTEEPVALIAQKVGYGTQSKFTQAFKESTDMLPTEYRKTYRNFAGGKT